MKALAAIAVFAALAVALVQIDPGADSPTPTKADAGASGDVLGAVGSADGPARDLPVPEPEPPATVQRGPRHWIAHVQSGERIELRDEPGGRVLETVGDQTEFGSRRTFWIAEVRGDWLGVPAAELPNGRLAWIEDDREALDVFVTPFWLAADVSARRLELRSGGKVLSRFPVTVGSPSSPTPLGRYAVTDGISGPDVGPDYGCCILALTGHQPRLPPDWIGGDRIAIHGTPGPVGGASSTGCMRASDRDIGSLFGRVPLGAPVFIRA